MRFPASAAVAISVITAGLAAGGCASSSSGSAASGTTATSAATQAAQSAPASAATPTASSSAAGSASGGTGSGGECQPSQLRASLGAKGTYPGTTTQNTQKMDLTNTSSAPCVLDGYPGVNLVGTVSGQKGYQWPLERGTTVAPSKVTVAPGSAAHFTVVYLAWGNGTAGREITVNDILVTPPDDYSHTSVAWSQSLLLQDAATHPGTWIEAIQPGA